MTGWMTAFREMAFPAETVVPERLVEVPVANALPCEAKSSPVRKGIEAGHGKARPLLLTGVIESYVFPLRTSEVLPLRTGSGVVTYGADNAFKTEGYTFRLVV